MICYPCYEAAILITYLNYSGLGHLHDIRKAKAADDKPMFSTVCRDSEHANSAPPENVPDGAANIVHDRERGTRVA